MKKRLAVFVISAAIFAGAAPAAQAVDVRQENNVKNCYLGKRKDASACERLLAGRPMSAFVKNCLIKAGIGGAGALIVGRFNKEVGKKIAVNVVGAGATGCLVSLV
ncbi:hypothetical protein [Streptomyces sp. NPDC051546]|uniref:hypothetical protein n=1 Tax=Streptomyces sp. NPDC051546 TaxID=3365655 RepID=UPI0037912DD3